jgi:hypothetical protein
MEVGIPVRSVERGRHGDVGPGAVGEECREEFSQGLCPNPMIKPEGLVDPVA